MQEVPSSGVSHGSSDGSGGIPFKEYLSYPIVSAHKVAKGLQWNSCAALSGSDE